MAQKIAISAQKREKSPGQVRRAGYIPGVIYGHGIKNENVEVEGRQFSRVFSAAGYTTLVNVAVGTQQHTVLIREVQFHPLKDEVLHVDFYQVRLDEKVKASVPLDFIGESTAVKDAAGVLVKSVSEVELEALPQNLPRDLKVDISVLTDFEKVIHVSDLIVPEGVELLHQPEDVVALVQPPRSEQELESLSEEAKEDVAAVEVVSDKEKEEEPTEEGATLEAAAPKSE